MKKSRRYRFPEEPFEEPLINLTPLIDVVFVVLISFILIAPFLQIDSIELAPGKKGAESKSPKALLSLVISKQDQLLLNGEKIGFEELFSKVQAAKKQNPQITAQIIPDASSHFMSYQKAKNSFEEAGFSEIDVIIKNGN